LQSDSRSQSITISWNLWPITADLPVCQNLSAFSPKQPLKRGRTHGCDASAKYTPAAVYSDSCNTPFVWSSGSVRCGRHFPRVCPLSGNNRRSRSSKGLRRLARCPSSAASLHIQLDGSLQPLVRQVRYYRAPEQRASRPPNHSNQKKQTNGIGLENPREIGGVKCKTPLPWERRFAFAVLVTGLPANHGRWFVPPRLSQTPSVGLPCSTGPLIGGCSYRVPAFLWAGRKLSSSRYITGTV
jgi:hypothetical protein